MSHLSKLACSFVLLAMLGLTAGHARADCPQDVLPKGYKLSRTGDMVADPVSRFIWMRCSYDQHWSAESRQCTGIPYRTNGAQLMQLLKESTARGWVLPTREQLALTRVSSCSIPLVNGAAFPLTPPGSFWTRETLALWQQTLSQAGTGDGAPPMTAQAYRQLLDSAVDFSAGRSRESDMTPGTGLYVRLVLIPGSPEAMAAGITELWPQVGAH